MATKLGLYNAALGECGEPELTSLSEDRKPRHLLDSVYDDVVKYCLEQGQWKHAIRAIEANSDTNVDPTFGFEFAFEKPDDIIRILQISENEEFSGALRNYVEEGNYWYTDVTPIYVRYVSDDAEYGLNISDWPGTFTHAVGIWLARTICRRLTGSAKLLDQLKKDALKAFTDARSKDALRGPSVKFPEGRLSRARRGHTDGQRKLDNA